MIERLKGRYGARCCCRPVVQRQNAQKRDENVFRRGSIWWIRYTFHGEQLRESSRSEIKQDALNLLKEREGDIAAGRFRGLSRVTVGDLLDDVETDYRLNGFASLP